MGKARISLSGTGDLVSSYGCTPVSKGQIPKGLRFQRVGEVTKSRGIGRGGARPGSGRKKGSRDIAPRMRAEILGRLEEADQKLPLYEVLDRVRDETLDPKYRDLLRIQILPYMHPRLPAT
jgi:hypothetical protein